ncbi:type II toxin-antitoxin system VapC family toxin [soil metagenome]
MRILLDTHALIWWMAGDPKLPVLVREVILDKTNAVFVSAVSAYEIAFKHRMGKLEMAERVARNFEWEIDQEGFNSLAVTASDALQAGAFDHAHRDPFDRLLIAQALGNNLALVSNERLFDTFGVSRLW